MEEIKNITKEDLREVKDDLSRNKWSFENTANGQDGFYKDQYEKSKERYLKAKEWVNNNGFHITEEEKAWQKRREESQKTFDDIIKPINEAIDKEFPFLAKKRHTHYEINTIVMENTVDVLKYEINNFIKNKNIKEEDIIDFDTCFYNNRSKEGEPLCVDIRLTVKNDG